MPIPHARDASPPPPLPPPRYVDKLENGQDPGWQWDNDRNGFGERRGHTNGGSINAGSSLLLGSEVAKEGMDDRDKRDQAVEERNSLLATASNTEVVEGAGKPGGDQRSDLARPSIMNKRLQSEGQLEQRSRQHFSLAYDKQLVSKIGGPNTPSRTSSFSVASASGKDELTQTRVTFERLNGHLKSLSVPERGFSSIESPTSRLANMSASTAASPRFSHFRCPTLDEEVKLRRIASETSAVSEDSTSANLFKRGSYDHSVFEDLPMEDTGIKDLNIADRTPFDEEMPPIIRAGHKRLASEALREEMHYSNAANNEFNQRRSAQLSANRNSPVSRFQSNNYGSVSSASSMGPTSASYPSSYGLSVASSLTSYSSERHSPGSGALSPCAEAEQCGASPYATTNSLNPSPRGSVSRNHHQRALSDCKPLHSRKPSSDTVSHSRQNSSSKMQSHFICECCPKKPKKFDTQEELRMHEMEKQYTCQYCHNRFKNKNEAERHQNSLHLRRHSWSCAALQNMEAAFHPSTTEPNFNDICGYCGETFQNNPPNWEARMFHLNNLHKFGECNQGKKFFRADHFRQHLKHSHAGTSGKWTNMLENACMREEEPPTPMAQMMAPQAQMANQAQMAPQAQMANQAQMMAPQAQMSNQTPMMAPQLQMSNQTSVMAPQAQMTPQPQMIVPPQAQQRMDLAGMNPLSIAGVMKVNVIKDEMIDERLRGL